MTKDDKLADLIQKASHSSRDKAWRLPLDDIYHQKLKSPLADMVNAASGRAAGSLTAASFLSQFTKGVSWAHFDIAGTAWVSGDNNHATGRPVNLLIDLLKHMCHAN